MAEQARIAQLENFIRQIGYQPPPPLYVQQPQYVQNVCSCGNAGFAQCSGMANGMMCNRWHCRNCMQQAIYNGQPTWFCNGCYNYHHHHHRRHHHHHHSGFFEFFF